MVSWTLVRWGQRLLRVDSLAATACGGAVHLVDTVEAKHAGGGGMRCVEGKKSDGGGSGHEDERVRVGGVQRW